MSHGEIEPTKYGNVGNSNSQYLYEYMVSSPMHFYNNEPFMDRVGAMVNGVTITNEANVTEQPSAQAQGFYDMLEAT